MRCWRVAWKALAIGCAMHIPLCVQCEVNHLSHTPNPDAGQPERCVTSHKQGASAVHENNELRSCTGLCQVLATSVSHTVRSFWSICDLLSAHAPRLERQWASSAAMVELL